MPEGTSLPAPGFRQFASGLSWPFRGAGFILSHRGVKRYAMLPMLVNAAVYAVAVAVLVWLLYRWQIGDVEWVFWGPVGGYLASAVNWLGWGFKFMLAMLSLLAAFFTFTAVGMVIASPLNELLSEKVEAVQAGTGRDAGLPAGLTVKIALLSLADTLLLCGKQLLCSLLALPFLLVPLVGFLPLFAVGAYFAGLNFIDVPMSRNRLRRAHKKAFAEKNFWEILAFGATMQILFLIPFFGLFLLPVGVAGGTLLYCRENWGELLAKAGLKPPEGFSPPSPPGPGNEPAGHPPVP